MTHLPNQVIIIRSIVVFQKKISMEFPLNRVQKKKKEKKESLSSQTKLVGP